MISSCFLNEWNRIKKLYFFQIITKITYRDLSRNLENSLILNFDFIHCKTVFCLMSNGTELRSFSNFQILTKIAHSDISRNLQIDQFWSSSSFTVELRKSVKMIKSIVNMISSCFLDEWNRIKKFFLFSNFDQNHIQGP